MYTQLLHAAFEQRVPIRTRPTRRGAVEAAAALQGSSKRHAAVDGGRPTRCRAYWHAEIGYDVALLELAQRAGHRDRTEPL